MAKILSARDDIASQVGGEVIRGPHLDGSGNPLFKSEDTLSAGYTDKTTLTNWDLYGALVDGLDYDDFRNILIADFVGSWGSLSDVDKKTLIRHYVYDSAETVPNLDLLYTQSERDDFQSRAAEALNTCDCNLRKEINIEGYWNVLPDSTGKLTITELKTDVALDTYDPPAGDYIKITDTKAASTDGGTFTFGAWRTRVLNTEDNDAGGHASISSNQITLEAGTYYVLVSAPAFAVNAHHLRLRNITDSTTDLNGTSENASASVTQSRSFIMGQITIAASKTFEVQQQCQTTKSGNGLGVGNPDALSIFTVFEAWKLS